MARRPPQQAKPGIRYFQGDITSAAQVREATAGAEIVFHLAGQTSVPRAEADPEGDRRANVGGMQNLVDAIREHGSKAAIVNAGTSTEAGLPPADVVDETTADHPVTVYDTHKLEAERLLERASRAGHLNGVTLRLTNVYGPGPRSGSPDRGILNQFVRRALAGEPLTVFGEGNYLRDYIYVDDVAEAFIAGAKHAVAIGGQHFVLGTGERRTFADAVRAVAVAVERRTGRVVPVLQVDEPATMSAIDRRSYVADPSRFTAATGWRPRITFEVGLDRTIQAAAGE